MNEIERVARAIHGAKMEGHNPDCLYQHQEYEDWYVDDRREYADPFTGQPRIQLFHKAWRHYEKAAIAAIAAMRGEPVNATDAENQRKIGLMWETLTYVREASECDASRVAAKVTMQEVEVNGVLERPADLAAENQRLRAEVEALREALGRIASDEGRWSDPDSPQRIAREALTRKAPQ